MKIDYAAVTETPGVKASKEQIARLFQRYHFALQFCRGKDVLEVACGAGQGLGYMAKIAKKVVGGDIDENCLKFAQDHYRGRKNIELRLLDAHKLPFGDKSFDVVLLYEAIYYLAQPETFLKECRRILRKDGVLIICSVNQEWTDFNPSPHSTKYFSVPELNQFLGSGFSEVKMYGAFDTSANSITDRVVSMVKRTAVFLHLIPKTMKGKEALKRIFFGKLLPLPAEIDEQTAKYEAPAPIPGNTSDSRYKVIFAEAHGPKG